MKLNQYVMNKLAALAWVWLLSSIAPVAADTIFADDFQDGSYSDWTLSGDGYDAANYYYGNYSMRLDGLRQGEISISSAGYTGVSLTMELAALYLVNGDYCYAEYSTDGGSSWQTLRWLGNGADDGYFRTTTVSTGLDNNPNIKLRFRAYTLYYHYCYGDNLLLTGTPATGGSPEITVSGSGTFGNVTVGTSSTKTITVSNDGDANLDLGSLSGLAAPFSLSSDDCSNTSVAPGTSCSAIVQFSPTAAIAYSDTLNIPSNANNETTSTVSVSGAGVSNGGGGCDYDCLDGSGNVNRSAATYSQLTGSSTVGLVNYSHYTVPSDAMDPINTFEGTLTLTIVDGTLTEQGTNLAGAYSNPDRLPNFSYQFVQHGTHIIPVDRGVLPSSGSDWEYILAPGRVWNERGDNGYSRVSLPFALTERNANCVHNGVMTFLFDDSGAVSQVAYQIAQETCLYFKYNLHGELNASYNPSSVPGTASIKSAYETEVNNRMPTKPISALESDYPGNGVVTSNIGSEVTSSHMTLFGIAYNGVHYTGGCDTRQGSYPYCEVMAVPSYSTAKSVVAGLGLMRLEQLYSGSQQDLSIGDYVSECSGFQWKDVTWKNALNMATGNYNSSSFMADEGSSSVSNNFFLKETHADKVNHACGYYRMTTPNTTFVYHTSDTYLLGRAMNVYYKAQAGSSKDVYKDLLVNDIWKPLGMSPATHESKRTYDSTAQFWSGYGLIYHSDDVVKLAEFLNKDNGKIGATQMLDTGLLNSALQKNSGDRGLNAGSSNDKYQNGFWAFNLNASSEVSACTTETWVPYLSGFGGISVVLLPNGMVYYFFSDNDEHSWTSTAKELDKISSICN